jgi:ABC-type methionine transport system ATPase subunit
MATTPVTRAAPRPARRKSGAQTRVKLYLTYPSRLVREPLIYDLSRTFDLVFNIRQASVNEEIGIIAIELDGTPEAIESGIAWLRDRGVTVEPIEKNVIE